MISPDRLSEIGACETPTLSARGLKLNFTIKSIAAQLSALDVYGLMYLEGDEFSKLIFQERSLPDSEIVR